MNSSRVLFNTLMHNSEMPMPKTGVKGNIYLSFGIIAVSCIMIPCCIAMGYISYMLSSSMMNAEGIVTPEGNVITGAQMNGLLSELHILSAFSMVFSLLVIFNVLFFSSDLQHLIPLPFKPVEILRGKFFHTYIAESIMEFMILLSVFIGYFAAAQENLGIGSWLNPVSVISVLIGTFVTPLLPLVYCALVSFLLMTVLKGIHNIKIFYHSSTVLLALFLLLFFMSFGGLGGINLDNYMNSIAEGNNLFLVTCNAIFFTSPILAHAVETGSLPDLLLYLAGNAAALGVMLFIGSKIYPACLYTAAALGESKKTASFDSLEFRMRTPVRSYFVKEIRTLIRTRAYASNCVVINLLWPVGVMILFAMTRDNGGMQTFINMYGDADYPRAKLIMLLAVIAVSFIASAMNSLSSTAFTREGLHADLIKYLPIDYNKQLRAKAAVSFLLTWPALIVSIVITGVFVHFSAGDMIYFCIISLEALILSAVIGFAMDSSAPYTDWSDEYSALRGNLNSFFNMAMAMVAAGIMCGVTFICFEYGHMNIIADQIMVLVILGVIDIPAVIFGRKLILRNMAELS
ncbi:MAG: hypothetical protein K6C99_06050 [Lachnospiraceae bacterium]|nr:hypothetical protein [Lachnospiraceae bacterium]